MMKKKGGIAMTDLHCHILPGLDDGAQTLQDALDMARLAAVSGVNAIVATPHCNLPHGKNQNFLSDDLLQAIAAFRQALHDASIPLRLYGGAEVFCTPETSNLLKEQRLLPLAGSRYLLTEFYFDEAPEFMEECFTAIGEQGFIPVIAHPERYEAVQRAPEMTMRWFHKGQVIQLNKGSILGRLGPHAQQTARWILERGLAHVVASDAHSANIRTPHMAQVRRHLEEVYDPQYAKILLSINPGRIVRDQNVLDA
jgi:protein-tyrosine phosphatase